MCLEIPEYSRVILPNLEQLATVLEMTAMSLNRSDDARGRHRIPLRYLPLLETPLAKVEPLARDSSR